jgi:hypothetical protein
MMQRNTSVMRSCDSRPFREPDLREPRASMQVVTAPETTPAQEVAMSRDQIVRDTAYAIWEAEGKPDGRHHEHWSEAQARVTQSVKKSAKSSTSNGGGAPAKASAKGQAAAKGKPSSAAVKREPAAQPPAKGTGGKTVSAKVPAAKAATAKPAASKSTGKSK